MTRKQIEQLSDNQLAQFIAQMEQALTTGHALLERAKEVQKGRK